MDGLLSGGIEAARAINGLKNKVKGFNCDQKEVVPTDKDLIAAAAHFRESIIRLSKAEMEHARADNELRAAKSILEDAEAKLMAISAMIERDG